MNNKMIKYQIIGLKSAVSYTSITKVTDLPNGKNYLYCSDFPVHDLYILNDSCAKSNGYKQDICYTCVWKEKLIEYFKNLRGKFK